MYNFYTQEEQTNSLTCQINNKEPNAFFLSFKKA